MRLLGLDEAGRGSVLGPLVVGAYCCDGPCDDLLRAAGAADSKSISAKKRVQAREALRAHGHGRVRMVEASEIDCRNLNELEEEAFVGFILEFEATHVWIDAPVHPAGIPNLLRRLQAAVPWHVAWVVEPKADVHYPVVGAASIFAKVARDEAVHALGGVGSGYPSDPVTRAWIRGFFERGEALPACVRSRWDTIAQLRQVPLQLQSMS